jgi:hypothetical protein
MRRPTTLLIVAMLAALLSAPAFAKTAAELLREGLYAEEVEGNLEAAIQVYQQIIADSTAPRNLVAQALYRQGMCFLKKKQEQEAKAAFQKLVTDYSDQTELVEKVRPMLEELGNADPASLMPPETIVYVEIGSPGRQVETILNMLKGTAFEKTLAQMNQVGPPPDAVSKIVHGLLNPAMLAEMKKIRGIGIGVTDIGEQTPSALIVLFPGKSDALRSLLTMALGMLGRPTEAVEGMQTVSFRDGGGAAYDDNVIIVASPSPKGKEMLQWSVQQYKGPASRPSLASDNKAFAKVSKQARQQNALTVWVNVDEAYARLCQVVPADQVPPQIKTADGFVDLKNVDDLIASLSLRETGVALEVTVDFKEGHQSMFYSMIRTPYLKKDAFKAVPAEAVALVSLALGEAGTAQAQVVSEKLRQATGQDIGALIFGNIEQVALFAVPPKESVLPDGPQLPLIARSVGLVIDSRNPQQTQQLILRLLQTAKLIPADASPELPAGGRYEIALTDGPKLFGYTDQASKTMLLSLNAQVVETSVTTMKQDTSVVRTGKLHDALATLSPTTSKLILVNVGGLLRLAAPNMMNFPSEEMTREARASLDELIKACEKTTLRLQTSEETNRFSVRLSVSDLPPMDQVMGPAVHLAQMVHEGKASMAQARVKAPATTSIPQAPRAPVIDGNPENAWAGVPSHTIEHVTYAPASSDADLSARFKAMYDKEALYILVDVTDDQLRSDSAEFWLDDGVEVFIDADNSKSDVYGENDYQYHFDWDSSSPAVGEAHHNKTAGVQYAFARTDDGYRLEAKFPWSMLGAVPNAGTRIGLDIHVNDDDDGGDRDTKRMWCAERDVAWQNPQAFGTGELAGLIGWWKLDETGGTTAADSSGNGHHATVCGNPQWQPTAGRIGGAVAFDGDGDYLEVADEPAFDFTAGVTVAAWIKAQALDKAWQAIVTKGEWAWRIQRNAETSTVEFACSGVHVPGDSQYGSLFGSRSIPLDEWHHIVGVYDGKRMYVYMDGALDTSQDASGPIGVDDDPVLIGENAAQRGRWWNGAIDDVRVYNYGLPEAQVQQLFREAK